MPVIRKRTISEEVSMLSEMRRKMFSEQSKPTNADRIRAMSDEELSAFLWSFDVVDIAMEEGGG